MADMKKKLENEAGVIEGYEESRKKNQREIEALQMRIEQLLAENDKLNKSKKKLQSEVRSLMVSSVIVMFDIQVQEDDVLWLSLQDPLAAVG